MEFFYNAQVGFLENNTLLGRMREFVKLIGRISQSKNTKFAVVKILSKIEVSSHWNLF